MRLAHNDTGWVRDDKGAVVGINLGYDYCAEHEWGVKKLLTRLGVKSAEGGAMGLESRLIRNPDEVKLTTRGAYLCLYSRESYFASDEEVLDRYIKDYGRIRDRIIALWDEREFLIMSNNPDEFAHLKDLFRIIQAGQAVIGLKGSNNPFAGTGLNILSIKAFTKQAKKDILARDKEAALLRKESARIQEVIREAWDRVGGSRVGWGGTNQPWFYLGAKFFPKDGKPQTYWLNPMAQNYYNAGYFTEDELLAWTRGEGPIIKGNKP